MNINSIWALTALAVVIFIWVFVEILIRQVAERRTRDFMNSLFQEEERVSLDDPYEFLQITPRNNAEIRKKRIALIASAASANQFTSRQRIIPMGLTLLEVGYEVVLFVPCWDCTRESLRWSENATLPIVKIGLGKLYTPQFDFFLFWRLLRKVLDFGPDVLYCFKPIRYSSALALTISLLRRVMPKLSNLKIVIDSDDWEGRGGWAGRRNKNQIVAEIRDLQERLTIKNGDIITTTTTFLYDRARKLRGNSKSVHLIYNGIRREFWPKISGQVPPPSWLSDQLSELGNPKMLLLYTRYVEVSARDIISIFSAVLNAEPNVALLVVGSSLDIEARIQRLQLFSLAKSAGIETSRIIIAGWVPYRELPHIWYPIDVAICPYTNSLISQSRFPTKILELMAAGKAVVASGIGEIPKIIEDGDSGFLVPADDLAGFADKVIWLLRNPGVRKKIGEAAWKRAHELYDWEIVVRILEDKLGLNTS